MSLARCVLGKRTAESSGGDSTNIGRPPCSVDISSPGRQRWPRPPPFPLVRTHGSPKAPPRRTRLGRSGGRRASSSTPSRSATAWAVGVWKPGAEFLALTGQADDLPPLDIVYVLDGSWALAMAATICQLQLVDLVKPGFPPLLLVGVDYPEGQPNARTRGLHPYRPCGPPCKPGSCLRSRPSAARTTSCASWRRNWTPSFARATT